MSAWRVSPDGTTAVDRHGEHVLVAQARWSRDADLIVDRCPVCARQHRHGAAGEGGLRVSHCSPPHAPCSYLLHVPRNRPQRGRAGSST
jgi:hypothetical protein